MNTMNQYILPMVTHPVRFLIFSTVLILFLGLVHYANVQHERTRAAQARVDQAKMRVKQLEMPLRVDPSSGNLLYPVPAAGL